MKLNHFQTPLDDHTLSLLSPLVQGELYDFIESVDFIKWLISPEDVRGYAKDRPKESKHYNDGRIEVDLTKPHIIEGMDYFRQAALHFEQHGCYTKLVPNKNPNSEYTKFWKEEKRRWEHGLVRESDGEWIPGYYYFYLNYAPIWRVIIDTSTGAKGKRKGKRIKSFAKPWLGDYLFYHYVDQAINEGQHGDMLKMRGCGASYKFGSFSPCNMYVKEGLPNFHLASDKTFLVGEKGVFGKVIDVLDWIAQYTPMPRLRLVDTPLEKQLGYKDEYGVRKGILSSAYGISIKDDPDKARGIRGPLIHYEENGVMPNFEHAWNVNRAAVEDGDLTYGFMFGAGTGGTVGSDFEGAEKVFYNPGAYNVYGVPNVFDRNTQGKTKCGWFWGAYLNRAECYNEDGEPDVIKALIEILTEREDIRHRSKDGRALTQKKAELPIVPQEAVMRIEGTIFPVSDLKQILANLETDERMLSSSWKGELLIDAEGNIKPSLNPEVYPIREFPTRDNKGLTGCVEIFEFPREGTEFGRYIAGIDPYDDDESFTDSLGSVFIMDLFTGRIVAEYTGRPHTAKEFYENTRRLLKFYNAQANYENNKKGLFSYFEQKNSLHLLSDTPRSLRDVENIRMFEAGNKSKGTNASKEINKYGRRLIHDWMVDQAYDKPEDVLNMNLIRSVALLKEAITWNPDGNFDRISALGMCLILKQDKQKHVDSRKNSIKSKSRDPFFAKHFGDSAITNSLYMRKS